MNSTHRPNLTLLQPLDNSVVVLGQPFEVSGRITDDGRPEPHLVDSVTVQIDNQPSVRAALTRIPNPTQTVVSFTAAVAVTGGQDPHTLTVTATDDRGISVSASRKVFTQVAYEVDAPALVVDILSPVPFDAASFDAQVGSMQYMLQDISDSLAGIGKVLVGPNVQIANAEVGHPSRLRLGIWIEGPSFPVVKPKPPGRPLPTVPEPGATGGFALAPPVPVPASVASFGFATRPGLLQELADGIAQDVKSAAAAQGVTVDSMKVLPVKPSSVTTHLSGKLPLHVPFDMTITETVGLVRRPANPTHQVPAVVSSSHTSGLGSILDLIVAAVLSPFRSALAIEFLALRGNSADADQQITGMMQSLLDGVPARFPFNRAMFFKRSSSIADFPVAVLDWRTFGVAGAALQGSGLTTIEARDQSTAAMSLSGPTVVSGFEHEMDLVLAQEYTFTLTDIVPDPDRFRWTVSGPHTSSGKIDSPTLAQSGKFRIVFPVPRNVKVGNWRYTLTFNATETCGTDPSKILTASASLVVMVEVKPNPRH